MPFYLFLLLSLIGVGCLMQVVYAQLHPSNRLFPPPAVRHLSLKQWLQHRRTYGNKDFALTVFEWLEKEGLPEPQPIDYDFENNVWVDDMPQAQRKAYLESLDW